MIALDVPDELNIDAGRDQRTHARNLDPLWPGRLELPQPHLRIIEFLPQWREIVSVDVHHTVTVAITGRFRRNLPHTDNIDVAYLPFSPGRPRPDDRHEEAIRKGIVRSSEVFKRENLLAAYVRRLQFGHRGVKAAAEILGCPVHPFCFGTAPRACHRLITAQ